MKRFKSFNKVWKIVDKNLKYFKYELNFMIKIYIYLYISKDFNLKKTF